MKYAIFTAAILAASSALAQSQTQVPTDPDRQAAELDVQECLASKRRISTAAFGLAAKLETETKRADAAEKRATEAEAKVAAKGDGNVPINMPARQGEGAAAVHRSSKPIDGK